jgi:RNA polymerase sigma factor (sigma-70 family)
MNGEPADLRKGENPDDNERLVRAIAAGDRAAEREFALRYLPPVRAMLLARSRNPDLASDLRQDVMIEVICALRRGQLREPSKLTPFVIAIARNVLNSHYRASVREPESLELPDDLPNFSSAEETAEVEERENRAMDAISNLEPTDRTILQMILIDGLKPGAIAHRLNLSPDVVRQRKLRAIRRVTGLLLRSSQTGASGDTTLGRIR